MGRLLGILIQRCITFKYFRHALAVIHFNENLNRQNKMKDGIEQVHVVYPKFKNGEAVVRNVKVQQKFGRFIMLCQFRT